MSKKLKSSMWIMVLFALPILNVQAQNDAVPKAVSTTFNKMFTSVEELDWYDDEAEYTASFVSDTYQVEASFTADGKWLQTSTSMDKEDLPAASLKLINTEFGKPSYFISVTKMERPNHLNYLVSFEANDQTVSLTFDASGELLEKTIEDFDEDNR